MKNNLREEWRERKREKGEKGRLRERMAEDIDGKRKRKNERTNE